ncbi:MAG: DUF4399 domain-containing protein [Gammaproteobacteria bacterium]|nr:DUF4399 domain-containing protein [Gammaproteobacteria bacterium]
MKKYKQYLREKLVMTRPFVLLFVLLPLIAIAADTGPTPSKEGAGVRIISPVDGENLDSPVTVVFGLAGMGVAPAGVERAETGHHHLIIDASLPAMEQAIPLSENYRHFGGGQTQVTLDLEPGEHTLQLLLGDHNHIPHEPPVYSEIVRIRIR